MKIKLVYLTATFLLIVFMCHQMVSLLWVRGGYNKDNKGQHQASDFLAMDTDEPLCAEVPLSLGMYLDRYNRKIRYKKCKNKDKRQAF